MAGQRPERAAEDVPLVEAVPVRGPWSPGDGEMRGEARGRGGRPRTAVGGQAGGSRRAGRRRPVAARGEAGRRAAGVAAAVREGEGAGGE